MDGPGASAAIPARGPRRLLTHWPDVLCVLVIVAVWAFAWFPVIAQHRSLSTGVAQAIGVSAVDQGRLPPGFSEMPPLDSFRYDAGASAWQLEPWFETAIAMYRDGEVPLWNPYQGFGAPLAANFQSAVFDPLLMLPIAALGLPLGQDVSVLGMLLAGMLAAFCFARVAGLRRPAGVLLAIGFGLNGFFIIGSNNEFCRAYAYIPILLLLVELSVRRARATWLVLTAVATALLVYAGMPEITFLVLLVVGVYGAWRVAVGPRARLRIWTALLTGLALVVGLLLAAPLLVPAAEYVALSFNTHSGGGAASLTLPKWALSYMAVPFWAGTPLASPVGVKGWVGVGVCALAVFGGFAPTRARRHLYVPFALVFLFVAGRAYGVLPLHWVSSLPVFDAIIFDRWGQVVVAFSLVVMAAVGVDALARGALSRQRLILSSAAVLVGAVIGAVVIEAAARRTGVQWVGWQGANPLPLIRAAAGDTLLYRREIAVTAAAFLFVIVAAACWNAPLRVARRRYRIGAVVAVLIVAVELGSYAHSAWPIYSQRGNALSASGWVSEMQHISQDDSQGRVLGIDGKLTPDTPGAFGLSTIGAIDALYPKRYFDYVTDFLDPTAVDRFSGIPNFWDSGARNNPMFQLTGTRWVVQQGFPASVPDKNIVTDSGRAVPIAWRDDTATIRTITQALPRAFLVDGTTVVADQAAAAAEVARLLSVGEPAFGPRRFAVLEGEPRAEATTCADAGTARFIRYEPSDVEIATDARCGTYLILTDLFYPGWTATVDGVPTDILAADTAFRAVLVPKGKAVVRFEYAPRSFVAGLWIAASGLVVLAGICFAARRTNRAS